MGSYLVDRRSGNPQSSHPGVWEFAGVWGLPGFGCHMHVGLVFCGATLGDLIILKLSRFILGNKNLGPQIRGGGRIGVYFWRQLRS